MSLGDSIAAFSRDNKRPLIGVSVGIVVLGAVLAISIWRRKSSDAKSMTSELEQFPVRIGGVSQELVEKYNLRDFYIASSLNSCCSAGGKMYTYVGLEPLREVIKQGARALDFEVFTVKGEPVISTALGATPSLKATLNSVSFDDAMLTAARNAFSSGGCQNAGDPLIINIRMTTARDVYSSMAKSIKRAFGDALLHPEHPGHGEGESICRTPMKDVMGKAIIICTGYEDVWTKNESFHSLVNASADGMFVRSLSHYDVLYGTGNDPELTEYNKKHMSAVIPKPGEDTTILASIPMHYGCQMVFMDYSHPDSNFELMRSMFDASGSAFCLKPEVQRYVPVTVKRPPPQNPHLSYAPRTISKAYFSANI